MTTFTFDRFPTEEEIINDATIALRLQIEGGAGPEIAGMIIDRVSKPSEYTEEEFEEFLYTDTEGIKCLARLQDPNYSLADMTEEEREMTSMLWVNYMCDQPYGHIINSMYKFVESGVDYRRYAMEIISKMNNIKEMDEITYNGTIIYLWTMINVIRSIKKSIRENENVPSPHMFRGISLN